MWQQVGATEYLIAGLAIWLAILSIFLFKTISHYRKLTKGVKGQTLDKVLEEIIDKLNLHDQQKQQLIKHIQKLEDWQKICFSKHALAKSSGRTSFKAPPRFPMGVRTASTMTVVISSLHSRGGTRVYAKGVFGAKPTTHPFSKEEKEVVEKAARQV